MYYRNMVPRNREGSEHAQVCPALTRPVQSIEHTCSCSKLYLFKRPIVEQDMAVSAEIIPLHISSLLFSSTQCSSSTELRAGFTHVLHGGLRESCIYEECISPPLSGSSVLQHIEHGDVLQIHNKKNVPFYLGLPHIDDFKANGM